MKWKKIFRQKNGRVTSDCMKRMKADAESEIAACYMLINDQRRVIMFLTQAGFIQHVDSMNGYTHYCIIYYPMED